MNFRLRSIGPPGQVHFRKNVAVRAPKATHDALHRDSGPDFQSRRPRGHPHRPQALGEVIEGKADWALETLEAGLTDATAFGLPEKYRRRLRTTNMLERLIQEDPYAGEGDPDLSWQTLPSRHF